MPFKKLSPALKDILLEHDIETPTAFQQMIYSKIKSGANFFGIAPKGSGKTMMIVISVVQKLLSTKASNAPRALIFVEDKKAALVLEEIFNNITILMDIEILSIFDSQHIYNQKDSLYYGVDIVITTSKRLMKLYYQSGINLSELKMVIFEDAESVITIQHLVDLNRISESIDRCQYLVFAAEYKPRFDDLLDTFMKRSQVVKYVED